MRFLKYGYRTVFAWAIGLAIMALWVGLRLNNPLSIDDPSYIEFVIATSVIISFSYLERIQYIDNIFGISVIIYILYLPVWIINLFEVISPSYSGGLGIKNYFATLVIVPLATVFLYAPIGWAYEKFKNIAAGSEKNDFDGLLAVFSSLCWISIAIAYRSGKFEFQESALYTYWPNITYTFFTIAGVWIISRLGPWVVLTDDMIRDTAWYRGLFVEGKGPSMKFAGPYTYSKYPESTNTKKNRSGIYIGHTRFIDNYDRRRVFTKDDAHMLTIAMTGSGKSVTSIWPNLSKYGGSMIVIDPKGEHANKYFHTRKRINGNAFVLDPFNITDHDTATYNPLHEIDLDTDQGRKRLSAVSSSLITGTGTENKFWEESGRSVLDGAIAHVLSKADPENRNLPYVADMLIGRNPEGRADIAMIEQLHDEMKLNSAAGGLPQLAAMLMDQAGERAYGIITVELMRALKWVTDPPMRRQLTGWPDFHFGELQDHPATIFIALPFGDMKEQFRWLRTLVALSIRIAEGYEKKPDPRLVYVLDELKQYGKDVEQLREGVVTLRSAGVKLWPCVQNYGQLVDCFGAVGAQEFESSSTIQVYGVNDLETATWVSNKLGQHIHTKRGKGGSRDEKHVNALLEPSAVMQRLQKSEPVSIVFTTDGFPMMLERRAFKKLRIDGRTFKQF